MANHSPDPRYFRRAHDLSFAREAYGEPLGPFQPRGDLGGVIVRHGYVVTEWGEPDRPDMTFSVTKSFLSTIVGLALERGLIHSLNDPVRNYVPDPALFNTENNRRITWDHLLRQTSDWEGILWGSPTGQTGRPKRFRSLITSRENTPRLARPGSTTRCPRELAGACGTRCLASAHSLKSSASTSWIQSAPQIHGAGTDTRTLWANIDGVMLQSVSGGGHYGGGYASSVRVTWRDSDFLTLNRGNWAGEATLFPFLWVKLALTPTASNKDYGFMNWYLNTDHNLIKGAKESAFCHIGNGTNAICADPSTDTVAVVRWIKRSALGRVRQSHSGGDSEVRAWL